MQEPDRTKEEALALFNAMMELYPFGLFYRLTVKFNRHLETEGSNFEIDTLIETLHNLDTFYRSQVFYDHSVIPEPIWRRIFVLAVLYFKTFVGSNSPPSFNFFVWVWYRNTLFIDGVIDAPNMLSNSDWSRFQVLAEEIERERNEIAPHIHHDMYYLVRMAELIEDTNGNHFDIDYASINAS